MSERLVRRVPLALASVILCALALAAPAVARSTDSLAPPNAPPHWLPPEAWVYNHWLPYDEGRLYRLAGITRLALWRHLRDDRHTVAQLAARHGWRDPRRLARALVAPRAQQVGRARLRLLESRALRTLTQGHLAQHVFFHSLHQFAIPSAAPDIFGVTDIEFRALRRSELSPLDIGRLHGRSPARVQAQCAAVLRERVHAGIRGKAMTARQGRILLRRQLSQLPRWLGQERYNGPPRTHRGALVAKPRDYASNPALAGDGRHLAFESYQQKLRLALRRGEISVITRDLVSGAQQVASTASAQCSLPSSSYNPTISGDGRYVAFECSEGNLNFAKRYGQISVFVRDTVGQSTLAIAPPRDDGRRVSRSFYSPAISADGRLLAFVSVQPNGRTAVLVRDVRTGVTSAASRGLSGDVYEPSISGDGRRVAFTVVPPSAATSHVYVHDLDSGATELASRAGRAAGGTAEGFAANPAISPDGRYVAFASAARKAGARTRIYLRDLVAHTTTVVSDRAHGTAFDPAISRDGRVVAYTSVARGDSRVLVRDLARGLTQVASRAGGAAGALADGASRDPSISFDGTRVAFASTAGNLSRGKRGDARAVFVRDLAAQTTTLASLP